MVYTKVFQIKHSNKLKQSVQYIDDEKKTKQNVLQYDGELKDKLYYIIDDNKTTHTKTVELKHSVSGEVHLVSSYGLVSIENAYDEMLLTKLNAKQAHGDRQAGKADVLAHHVIQSFSPEDNLTPEQVHEIGRRTILELTGGEHEFVIATHLDQKHLHNHIIFNTTNNVSLKKFRWQKGTKRSLEHISDKHAELSGAKVITQKQRFGHKEYVAYIQKQSFRTDIKRRLDFLKKNSKSIDDFLEKATLLNLSVDFSKNEAVYKLMNSTQKRNVRDGSLSKRGYYSKEAIEKSILERIASEESIIDIENIKEAYKEFVAYKDNEFEYRFFIEQWQVEKETDRGIYLNVSFGIQFDGMIFIDNKKFDKVGNDYELFIKNSDYFYFTNSKHAEKNKAIRGYALALQLSLDNGKALFKKNYHVKRLDTLIEEFNYLSTNNITNRQEFDSLLDKFKQQVSDVEKELDRLDSRIAQLNKLQSALLGLDVPGTMNEVSKKLISELKLPEHTNKEMVSKFIQDVMLERDVLHHKFDEVIKRYEYTYGIAQNVAYRNAHVKDLSQLKK